MLTELCRYLRNWFERERITDTFTVEGGVLAAASASLSDVLQEGQYYRIIGSVFNDGAHRWGDPEDALTDEAAFSGAVWTMAAPAEVLALAEEIAAWQAKYGGADSAAMSPYSTESFGGYSYSKYGGGSGEGGGATTGWQSVFAARLAPYRKL